MFLRECFRDVQLLNCTNDSCPQRNLLGRAPGAGVSEKWHLQCHLNSDFPWSSQDQEEMVLMPHWESTEQDWECGLCLFPALCTGPRMLWSALARGRMKCV